MADDQVQYELDGDVALIGVNRPEKRNALHDRMFADLGRLVERAGHEARAVVIHGVGPHFCAGLDLAETAREVAKRGGSLNVTGPHTPHVGFDKIARGRVPVVAALTGAVVGAGMELAAASHIRVADDTAFFALPEAQRGIFVGAGGSVRIQRLIGNARMTDMMLTGRTLTADEAITQNLVQYRVPAGEALTKARELAAGIARNTRESNWAIVNGLSRVNDMSYDDALFVETLVANNAVSAETQQRLLDFVEKRARPLDRPVS